MKKVCIIFLFFSMFFIFQHYFFRSTFKVNAQQCVGSHTYVDYSCDYNSFTEKYTCNTNGAMVQSCGNGTCTTFGPVFCQGGSSCSVSSYGTGCSVYYPQPAPEPAPTNPGPSPGGGEETPTGGYACGADGYCYYDPNGGSDYNSCRSSCGTTTGDPPGDPNAGVVVCGTETAAGEIFIKPGETKTWKTFAAPPGDRWGKLAGTSPGLVDVSYTAPFDKFVVGTAANDTVQIRSYYVYDALDRTWFFFQGPNKPPIVMSLSQEVVNRAVGLGYTQITDQSGAGAAAASEIEKRVYLLTSDNEGGHVWRAADEVTKAIVWHIPRSEYLVPFYNCASLMYTQNSKPFFAFQAGMPQPFCFGRGGGLRNPELAGLEDKRFTTGNYLGMEQDWGRSDWMVYDSELTPYKGNAANEDMHLFAYAETSGNAIGIGYVRMMTMEIPKSLLVTTTQEHNLYPYIHADNNNEPFEPAKDENTSDPCTTNPGGIEMDVGLYEDPTPVEPRCDGFEIYQEIPSGSEFYQPVNKLRMGQKYLIRSRIQDKSVYYPFYNQNFNDPVLGYSPVDGWQKEPGITTFEIASCGGNCPPESTDSNVLKMAQQANSTAAASTNYFETNSTASNKTFTVGFWARTESSSASISIDLTRFGASIEIPPYHVPNEPTDTARLKFPTGFITSTSSITVSPTWKYYEGTITFPDTANDSSKMKIIIRAPLSGGAIYYDDFSIIGWDKPIIGFNMVRADNQCATSNTIAPVTSEDPSTGTYWADLDLSTFSLSPGLHHIFAKIDSDPTKIYVGNPNGGVNCGITDPKWDYSIAADDPIGTACLKTIEIASCNENTPPTPTFGINPASATNGATTAYVGTSGTDYRPQGASITQMPLIRTIYPTVTTTLPLRVSIQSGQAADVSAVEYQVFKMDHNGNKLGTVITSGSIPSANGTQTNFDFAITPTETMSNQILIEVTAVNGNSCVDNLGIDSEVLVGKVVMMGGASGNVYEVLRDDVGLIDCHETFLTVPGTKTYANVPNYANALQAIGVPDPNSSTNPQGDNYINFAGAPFSYITASGHNVWLMLPYNVNNTYAWQNQMRYFDLTLPVPTAQDSLVCLDCNKKSNDEVHVCRYPAEQAWTNYSTGASQEVNFFITRANLLFDSWWQSRGGLVASVGRMESLIPIFNGEVSFNCRTDQAAYCQPFLNAKSMEVAGDYLTSDPSAGVPFTNSDTLEARTYVTQRLVQAQAKNAGTVAIEQDYDYFRALFKNPVAEYNPALTWSQNLSAATYTSEGDTDLFVMEISEADSNSPEFIRTFTATSTTLTGAKVILFVNGNLRISGTTDLKLNNVDETAFLMYIVKKDIIFSSGVGYSGETNYTQTEPIVEGVFLADDDIIVESKDNSPGAKPADNKFVAEGSFIALNKVNDGSQGIDLQRKFDDMYNSLAREKNSYSPVEMFIFRPDFAIYAPEIIKRPSLTWKEAN